MPTVVHLTDDSETSTLPNSDVFNIFFITIKVTLYRYFYTRPCDSQKNDVQINLEGISGDKIVQNASNTFPTNIDMHNVQMYDMYHVTLCTQML